MVCRSPIGRACIAFCRGRAPRQSVVLGIGFYLLFRVLDLVLLAALVCSGCWRRWRCIWPLSPSLRLLPFPSEVSAGQGRQILLYYYFFYCHLLLHYYFFYCHLLSTPLPRNVMKGKGGHRLRCGVRGLVRICNTFSHPHPLDGASPSGTRRVSRGLSSWAVSLCHAACRFVSGLASIPWRASVCLEERHGRAADGATCL